MQEVDGGPPEPISCSSWTKLATIKQGTFEKLWAAAPDTIYVLVRKGNGGGEVRRLEGKTLKLATTTSTDPTSIWASGLNDIYVTLRGYNGINSVLHFDGVTWRSHQLRGASSVRGLGPAEVYVAGAAGRVFRFNGGSWAQLPGLSSTVSFNAVWPAGARDLFVAGVDGSTGVIYHFDGASWTRSLEVKWFKFRSLWGAGPADMFAMGYGGGGNGRIYRFDGLGWTKQTLPLVDKERILLETSWGSSGRRVFAGGLYTLLGYNGQTWTALALPGKYHDIHGLWGSGASLYVAAYEWGGSSALWLAECSG